MTCEFRLQEADVPPSYNLGLKDSSGVVDDKVFESLEISNAVCFCCSPVICTLCMKIQPLNAGMEGLLNKVFDGMFEPLCFCSLEVSHKLQMWFGSRIRMIDKVFGVSPLLQGCKRFRFIFLVRYYDR